MLSCEEFFSVAPAPVDLEEVREKVKSFAMQHISSNRKLVLITVSTSHFTLDLTSAAHAHFNFHKWATLGAH